MRLHDVVGALHVIQATLQRTDFDNNGVLLCRVPRKSFFHCESSSDCLDRGVFISLKHDHGLGAEHQWKRGVFQKESGVCKVVSQRGLSETKSLVPFNKTKAQEVCKCHRQPPLVAAARGQQRIVTKKLGQPVSLILRI